MPDHGLGAVHRDALGLREHLADRLHLGDVADERRRRVRVDVVDLLLLDARVLEGELDAGGDAEAVGAGVGHVVGVAGDGALDLFFFVRRVWEGKRVSDFLFLSLDLDLALKKKKKKKKKKKHLRGTRTGCGPRAPARA